MLFENILKLIVSQVICIKGKILISSKPLRAYNDYAKQTEK